MVNTALHCAGKSALVKQQRCRGGMLVEAKVGGVYVEGGSVHRISDFGNDLILLYEPCKN